MVEIKLDTREIVFRTLYLGRERATKFATLRTLQEELAQGADDANLTVFLAGGDRIVSYSRRLNDEPPLFGMEIRSTALTLPGAALSRANETLLLRAADAVVWLDDGEPSDDPAGALAAFRGLIVELERSGRAPEDLPLWVQGHGDVLERRARDYKKGEGRWRPTLRTLGENDSAGRTQVAVERDIVRRFRSFERELDREGLVDHIKVRDRVYEKVCLLPQRLDDREAASSDSAPPAESRLVKSFEKPRRSRLHWLAYLLCLAAAAAAAGLSFAL